MTKGSIAFSGFLDYCDDVKAMYPNRRLHFMHGFPQHGQTMLLPAASLKERMGVDIVL
jgi:hypothetical protein